jgi:chemotaxis receptor (MCP) glutamine deamidase CheD
MRQLPYVDSKEVIYIAPGALHVVNRPVILDTLLGSCVAVCLYDPLAGVGGINHILLPGNERQNGSGFGLATRYGIFAMEHLRNKMLGLGANLKRLQAKVFGGGHILTGVGADFNVGKQNVDFVISYLETEAIPIISRHTGGRVSRRIFFHTDTFDVFVQKIPVRIPSELIDQETALQTQIQTVVKKPGEVTLFVD